MIQVTNRGKKKAHQQYSELDNKVFSAFCDSFSNINWIADFKDNEDQFCGIDLQLTAKTKNYETSYDIEIKSVHFDYLAIDYCFFQRDKWFSLNQWDNDYKLYVVIYPNLNFIAVWRINSDLLRKSEKEFETMKANTCNGNDTKEKLVYKLKFKDAKIYKFNLTDYNALYKEISNSTKK